jgi:hypothetical protein
MATKTCVKVRVYAAEYEINCIYTTEFYTSVKKKKNSPEI